VLDANGASVGAGLVDREAIDVPEGTYKILVHVPGAPTTIEGITITHHKLTSVELRKQGDKIIGAVVNRDTTSTAIAVFQADTAHVLPLSMLTHLLLIQPLVLSSVPGCLCGVLGQTLGQAD